MHEWWGLNDDVRSRAKQLAELGYAALAVDMFGEGKVADHPKDAGAFAGSVMKDPQVAMARFRAAMQALKSQPTVDPDKIAAIGYCMGGAIVLSAARQGFDLDAVASFHYAREAGCCQSKVRSRRKSSSAMLPYHRLFPPRPLKLSRRR